MKNAKNQEIPKTVRMKKIAARDKIYIQDGVASNGHWLVSIPWLLNLPRRRDLGMVPFCNRIIKAQVNAVRSRMEDKGYPTHNLEGIIKDTNLAEYAPMKGFGFIYGYIRGNPSKYDASALHFTGKSGPYLDIEYSALLFMDTRTIVLYKDSTSPVILQNSQGDIVAMVMPLNPTKIKSYLKGKA